MQLNLAELSFACRATGTELADPVTTPPVALLDRSKRFTIGRGDSAADACFALRFTLASGQALALDLTNLVGEFGHACLEKVRAIVVWNRSHLLVPAQSAALWLGGGSNGSGLNAFEFGIGGGILTIPPSDLPVVLPADLAGRAVTTGASILRVYGDGPVECELWVFGQLAPGFELVTSSFGASDPLTVDCTKTGTAVRWDLGDGTVVDDSTLAATYTKPGYKRARAYCTDGAGGLTQLVADSENIVEFKLNGLTGLTLLNLSGNKLTTAPVVTGNPSLATLDLSFNQLTTPPSVAGLSSLQTLNLQVNQLTTAPSVLTCPSLVTLNLNGNQITSPPSLANLDNLMTAILANNQLASPPTLTGCTSLENLDLTNNALTVAPALTGLTALAVLNLAANAIASPPVLTGLANLLQIDLSSNSLATAPDMTDQTALQTLVLNNNALTTVTLPASTSLVTVDVANNALTETAVNAVLVALDTLGATDGTVDLSGGTNAAPTGAGLTAQASLEGKGWTVTVNP